MARTSPVALLALLLLTLAIPARGAILPDTGEISGVARDGTGRALAGVQVLIARLGAESAPMEGRTDREGRFRFHGLAPAEYLVVATKVGYLAGIARVSSLPTTGLVLVLALDAGNPDEELTWVLRLPARDLLRAVEQDLSAGGELPAEGRAVSESLTTSVRQTFGLSLAGPARESVAASGGPDLDTRVSMEGLTSQGVSWRSGASYRTIGLSDAEGSRWRQTERLEVAGAADFSVDRAARLTTAARVSSRRLSLDGNDDPAESHAIGLTTLAELTATGNMTMLLDAREQRAAVILLPDSFAPEEEIRRRGLGLRVDRTFEFGPRHTLKTSLGRRQFNGSGPDGLVLLEHWVEGPGGSAWLAPEGGWWVASVRDHLLAGDGLSIAYGAELQQRDGAGPAWIPGMDLTWTPATGTTVEAGVSYRAGGNATTADGERRPDPVSGRLSLRRQFGPRTRVAVGVAQENLLNRDPFVRDPAGLATVPGIWTDGRAMAREVRMTLDRAFGKVEGRLQYHAGRWEGRLVVPDPFEFSAAVLGTGVVRFSGVQAAIAVLTTGTEVAVALDRLGPDRTAEYTTVGLRVSQGLGRPFRGGGDWRLLLDYEGIEGGRPFREAPPVSRVARVSGGVAVRF
jgi:hypothetical protein